MGLTLSTGVYKGRATNVKEQDSNRDGCRRWTCPNLDSLTVRHCDNLATRWLETLLEYRLHPCTRKNQIHAGRVLRPLPSARRLARGGQSASAPCTPQKGVKSPASFDSPSLASSPNGSFVAGWNPHENPQTMRRLTLVVDDCPQIPEIDLIFISNGSINVVWSA